MTDKLGARQPVRMGCVPLCTACPHFISFSVLCTLFLFCFTLFHLHQLPSLSSRSIFLLYSQISVCLRLLVLPHANSVSILPSSKCEPLHFGWTSPDTDVLFWTPHEYLNYSTFQGCFFSRCLRTLLFDFLFFLSPQMYNARLYKWMNGSFLRRPGTISLVKIHAWDTYAPLSVIFVGANVCHLLTGFNLVRRFSLLKSADVKKIRNPRGPIILRLGKTALLRPTE